MVRPAGVMAKESRDVLWNDILCRLSKLPKDEPEHVSQPLFASWRDAASCLSVVYQLVNESLIMLIKTLTIRHNRPLNKR